LYILTCSHREESLPEGPHLNLLLYTRNTTGSKARNPKGSYNLSAIYAFISWSAYEDVFYVVGSFLLPHTYEALSDHPDSSPEILQESSLSCLCHQYSWTSYL
jgi:hypothetical protein